MTRTSVLRFLAILGGFTLVLLPGCATVNATHPTAPANFVKRSGLAMEVKNLWLTANIVGAKNTFDSEDTQITWWAEFRPMAFLLSEQFTARWYAPDGVLFKETSGSTFETNKQYGTVSLPLRGTPAAEKLGWWRVEVFWKDRQIDTQTFLVGSPQEAYASKKVGSSPSEVKPSATESARKALAQSGLAVEAKNQPLDGPQPVLTLPGMEFRSSDLRVTWWGLLPIWSIQPWAATSAIARWYDPMGKLVMEQPIASRSTDNPKFAIASLPLRGQPWSKQFGQWRVEIIRRGETIDAQAFELRTASSELNEGIPAHTLPTQPSFEVPPTASVASAEATHVPFRRVALLVFPITADPLRLAQGGGELLGAKWLRKPLPMFLEFPDERMSWPERYGYTLIYNSFTKRYQTDFFWGYHANGLFDLRPDMKDESSWSRRFPTDLSEPLAQGFKSILFGHGFHVMDLTPYRQQCEGRSGEELVKQFAETYGAEALLLVGYLAQSSLYNSYVQYPYKTQYSSVGLQLTYHAVMYKAEPRQFVSEYEESIGTFPQNTPVAVELTHVVFLDQKGFPLHEQKKVGQEHARMIFEDRWLLDRVLSKIQGREYGKEEKVRIGGGFPASLPYVTENAQATAGNSTP